MTKGVLAAVGFILFLVASPLIAATKANPLNDKFLKLSDAERNAILERLVEGGRDPEPCGTATRNFFQGQTTDGTAWWSVQCSNGRSYSVSISADAAGSTKIIGCGILKAIARIDCFKKIEDQK